MQVYAVKAEITVERFDRNNSESWSRTGSTMHTKHYRSVDGAEAAIARIKRDMAEQTTDSTDHTVKAKIFALCGGENPTGELEFCLVKTI